MRSYLAIPSTAVVINMNAGISAAFLPSYNFSEIELPTDNVIPTTSDTEGSSLELWNQMKFSEKVEMVYQLLFFLIGTPINAVALFKFSRSCHSSAANNSRLIRLSRQLLFTHLQVLVIYSLWRSYWLYSVQWTMGDAFCKIYSFLTTFPLHLWSNIVVSIAIDMLCCVISPLKSVQYGHARVSWLIGLSWASAALCSFPMLILRGTVLVTEEFSHQNDVEFYQCYPLIYVYGDEVLLAYNAFHLLTIFYIPLVVIIMCYAIIGLSLRYQFRERMALGESKSSSATNSISKQQNTTHRFLIATVCIVLTFVLTWLPYQVLSLLQVICEGNAECETHLAKFNWLEAVLIASTCLNPFLYKFGIFKSAPRRQTITGLGGVGGVGGGANGAALYAGLSNNDSGGRVSVRSFAGLSTTISNLSSTIRLGRGSFRPNGSTKHGRDSIIPRNVVTLAEEDSRRASTCSATTASVTTAILSSTMQHRQILKLMNARKASQESRSTAVVNDAKINANGNNRRAVKHPSIEIVDYADGEGECGRLLTSRSVPVPHHHK